MLIPQSAGALVGIWTHRPVSVGGWFSLTEICQLSPHWNAQLHSYRILNACSSTQGATYQTYMQVNLLLSHEGNEENVLSYISWANNIYVPLVSTTALG